MAVEEPLRWVITIWLGQTVGVMEHDWSVESSCSSDPVAGAIRCTAPAMESRD
ncbi:MAG: hypothetical protein WCJ49_09020 [Deltaproteobacteria bacterium]